MKKLDDGFFEGYNYHDWAKYMVEKPEQKPLGPHFAAVLFDTRRDHDSYSGASFSVPHVVYFAFQTEQLLKSWVLRAVKAEMKFFFFEVKKLGEATVSVNVDLRLKPEEVLQASMTSEKFML